MLSSLCRVRPMLNLPDRTLYNRKIPKSKFYEKLGADSKLKDLFVTQIDSIIWKHKLSRETTNLEPTEEVKEIHVFEIHLRQRELSQEVLEKIDKAIPYPILHVLRWGEEVKLMIAYKERHATNENRAVVQTYYASEWQRSSEITGNLLNGLTLGAVYENMVRLLMPAQDGHMENLPEAVEAQLQLAKLERECIRLETRLRNEQQFDKKVELNIELRRKLRQLRRSE